MKLIKEHEGKTVTRRGWPDDGRLTLVDFGDYILAFKNMRGKEVLRERDDMDTEWVECGNGEQRTIENS